MKKRSRPKLVVVTRGKTNSGDLVEKIEAHGMNAYEFPTIKIVVKKPTTRDKEKLKKISSYDAIIFTSAHAVYFFCAYKKWPKKLPAIIAIGNATAQMIRQNGMKVTWIPKGSTSAAIAQGINEKYMKVIVPSSAIASTDLQKSLLKKGVRVDIVHMYTTEYITTPDRLFDQLMKTDHVDYLTFASPSSVIGFSKRLKNATLLNKARHIKAVCIGDTTAKTARQMRFKKIIVAKNSTTDDIIKALK